MGGGEKQDLCFELIHSIIQSHESCNEEICVREGDDDRSKQKNSLDL